VFIKDYFTNGENNSLLFGIIFWIVVYGVGALFIKKSEGIKDG